MMSTIGKKKASSQRGFSLIEALLSVVILSAGLVFINQTLLQSLTSADYANSRAAADLAAEKIIWETRNAAWSQRKPPPSHAEGEMLEGRETFPYEIKSVGVRGSEFLYEVRLRMRWMNSGRRKEMARTFYARLPYEVK